MDCRNIVASRQAGDPCFIDRSRITKENIPKRNTSFGLFRSRQGQASGTERRSMLVTWNRSSLFVRLPSDERKDAAHRQSQRPQREEGDAHYVGGDDTDCRFVRGVEDQ